MTGGRLYLPSLYASLQTTGLDTKSEKFSGQIVSTSTQKQPSLKNSVIHEANLTP